MATRVTPVVVDGVRAKFRELYAKASELTYRIVRVDAGIYSEELIGFLEMLTLCANRYETEQLYDVIRESTPFAHVRGTIIATAGHPSFMYDIRGSQWDE